MSQHDKYFVFPIACLQVGKSLNDVTTSEAKLRVSDIIDWCVFEKIKHNAKIQYEDNGETKLNEIASRHKQYKDDMHMTKRDFLAAQVTFGVTYKSGTWQTVQKNARDLEKRTQRHAGKKLSRVRRDFVFQTFEGRMSWRDFAIITAICAGCFDPKNRKAVPLTMGQIGSMALGYGSAKIVHTHDAEHLPLSDKAIGRTVEKLRQRGVFVKASPDNGRTTYYSNRMSEGEMIKYVSEVKTEKIKKRKARMSLSEIQQQVNRRAEVQAGLTPEERQQLQELTNRFKGRQ